MALLLNLGAIAADQFAAPLLFSSSPLWAATACLLLVWRRGEITSPPGDPSLEVSISRGRVAAFLAAHVLLVVLASGLSSTIRAFSGSVTAAGALLALWKLCVLVPVILLFPWTAWKKLSTIYFPEIIAASIVLLTFFPSRALGTIWPWYGQVLGRCVYTLARVFVPGLTYLGDLNPTLSGSSLDVTIIPECSGISGLELFDYLFGIVMILDWNRLRKGRALIGYWAGLFAMLLGNTIRITSLVVLGNRGFAEIVARFHIAAGSIFFSVVFLVFLSIIYAWMLGKNDATSQTQPAL